mmetsp:Transcript_13361/g.14981  ORF Transcript_13361/g.14981 Transcript_13361/m.14981 type:complete len:207 (-) Transcript_13361:706-1326(-)
MRGCTCAVGNMAAEAKSATVSVEAGTRGAAARAARTTTAKIRLIRAGATVSANKTTAPAEPRAGKLECVITTCSASRCALPSAAALEKSTAKTPTPCPTPESVWRTRSAARPAGATEIPMALVCPRPASPMLKQWANHATSKIPDLATRSVRAHWSVRALTRPHEPMAVVLSRLLLRTIRVSWTRTARPACAGRSGVARRSACRTT